MTNKFLVCETANNKNLGGMVYNHYKDAVDGFRGLLSEYNVEADEETIDSGIYCDDGGYTVQLIEIFHHDNP